MEKPIFSFVIPIYNEEETLPELHRRISEMLKVINGTVEVILVNDGSSDKSYSIMLDISDRDSRIKVVHLSRNFGHQSAITAGIDASVGEAVITLDADLQDPPEVILQMIQRWREGYEIVYAIRQDRRSESWFKRITAQFYYYLLRKLSRVEIPSNVGDFRLVDRRVIDAFRGLQEKSRFIRGMFAWLGFKQIGVPYIRAKRFAGTTKYPIKKMIKLGMDGILSFSNFPLHLVLNFGFLVSSLSFVAGIVVIILKITGDYLVPGWASLIVVIVFLSGVQLMTLGLIGEYIGRIFDEVKNRPLYIVSKFHGFSEGSSSDELKNFARRPIRE